MRRIVVVLAVIALCASTASAKEPKRDPETGIIRLLYIGAPFMQGPYAVFRQDPLLATTPVDGNLFGVPPEQVKKSMRQYMPRTREDMVERYDIIGLDDTHFSAHPSQTIHWLADGCEEDGLGLFMAGGFESFGGGAGYPSWGGTVLDRVLPVECTSAYADDGVNVVTNFNDELMGSIPWDEYEMHNVFGGHNVLKTRQGANQVSQVTRLLGGARDPGWVWWDVGNGRFFASAPGFRGGSAGKGFIRWKHYPDFVSNTMYFVAGMTPPSDIVLLYTTRQRFRDVDAQRNVVISTIDFISRFGADTRKVDNKIVEADDRLKEAKRHFVDLELAESKNAAEETFLMLGEAYDLAIEAKDTALFWVFLTEWLAVSATGLILGFVVWTLMVKRRLYKEVQVTRSGGF
jgi:uncharacterized membrane protein